MTAKKKRKHNILHWFILILNILAALGLLFAYAASYISPAHYWIFAFFGLAYPYLLLLNLFFVVVWLLSWKRVIWISIIVILVGYNHLFSLIQVRNTSSTTIPAGSIKVLSYNVHSLYEIHQPNEKGKAKGSFTSCDGFEPMNSGST